MHEQFITGLQIADRIDHTRPCFGHATAPFPCHGHTKRSEKHQKDQRSSRGARSLAQLGKEFLLKEFEQIEHCDGGAQMEDEQGVEPHLWRPDYRLYEDQRHCAEQRGKGQEPEFG
ncbi:MAG: hypothetical protein IPO87_06315 [Flavobacteriales bacterium]|nr:hypothetical protein [Flavobacteriales bacterium]